MTAKCPQIKLCTIEPITAREWERVYNTKWESSCCWVRVISLSLSAQAHTRTHHDAYVCTAIGEMSQKENVFVLVNITLLLLLLYICFPYHLYCSAQWCSSLWLSVKTPKFVCYMLCMWCSFVCRYCVNLFILV